MTSKKIDKQSFLRREIKLGKPAFLSLGPEVRPGKPGLLASAPESVADPTETERAQVEALAAPGLLASAPESVADPTETERAQAEALAAPRETEALPAPHQADTLAVPEGDSLEGSLSSPRTDMLAAPAGADAPGQGSQTSAPAGERRGGRTFTRPRLAGVSRRSKGVVGLDIEPGRAVAVQVHVNGKLEVLQAASVRLPGNALPEGEVADEGLLTDALRELFGESSFGKRVRIGVANQRTVLRMVELPPLSDRQELVAAVRFQAEDQLPMPLENALLDFQSVGSFDTPTGPRQRVAVVAAQRDVVERLASAVRAAGLRPVGVDLAAFALVRALHRREDGEGGGVLYLNVGGLTNMAIAEGTTCRFTRVVINGLEAMADRVSARREIPLERARMLLSAVGAGPTPASGAAPSPASGAGPTPASGAAHPLEEPHDEPSLSRTAGPVAVHHAQLVPAAGPGTGRGPADGADVRAILRQGIREIAGEVRNSLDFHSSQEHGPSVRQVVLGGSCLEISGFVEGLAAELPVPVNRRDVPFASHATDGVDASWLAIAAGLATEEAPQ